MTDKLIKTGLTKGGTNPMPTNKSKPSTPLPSQKNPPTDQLTDERLAAIEARLEAATPGPWRRSYRIKLTPEWAYILAPTIQNKGESDNDFKTRMVKDMHLIANAPTDIATLLAAYRELEGEVVSQRVYIESLENDNERMGKLLGIED